jgi:hypothetical protein
MKNVLTIIASAIPIITTTRTAPFAVFGFPAPNSFETRVLQPKQTNKHHDNDMGEIKKKHMYGQNQTLQKLQ